jgi:hypothetical protein
MMKQLLVGLALLLAACGDSSTAPEIPNYQGTYTLNGTVNGQPTEDLTGTLALTNQAGSDVAYTITFSLRVNQQPAFVLVTTAPGTATVGGNGGIVMTMSGPVSLAGNTVQANLRMDGTLNSSGFMSGSWTLTTTYPTSDAGSFTAQRQ